LASVVPVYGLIPVSLVTPVTLSKDPTAMDMWPVTWAETSLPLPTVFGQDPHSGGNGIAGGVVDRTSCPSVLGWEDVKHPVFGWGTCAMPARQSFGLFVDGGGVVAGGEVGGGGSTGLCAKAEVANVRMRINRLRLITSWPAGMAPPVEERAVADRVELLCGLLGHENSALDYLVTETRRYGR
jgi:hypothetical protein